MTATEIAGAILTFITVSGALWAIWWKIEGRVERVRVDAAARADGAVALANTARQEISEHKLHVAENYVSKQGHREATDQVMDAIGAVKAAIDGTNQRIDRMWESHGKQ